MARPLSMVVVAALLAACSTPSKTPDAVDSVEDTGTAAGDMQEVEGPDLPVEAPDVGMDLDLSLPDLPDTGDEPACQPGEGCFLDKCDENSQCLSGWCVDHMGEGVCSINCQEECPPGWSCQQVGTGPDVAYICISQHANLCRPCATGDNCKSPGGAEDVCVVYGSEGSFCGGACLSDEECPWGFSCGEAVSVAGIASKQCVADAGVCPCTAKGAALGWLTPCAVTNEHGTCDGQRVCTDTGLTDCDAATPGEEVCNGVDDDCDGEVDEPLNEGGKYVELCDDGNECTADTCLGEAGCEQEALSGDECKDNNPCTIGDHCEAGVCVGQLIDCDDQNPCTEDFCNPAGGCAHSNSSDKCDDGDVCTVADQCQEGACVGYPVSCDCQEDADCAALEDGNLCNGTLLCSKEKLPYLCVLAPETVVACPEPEGKNAPCLAAACDPESGDCSLVPAHEGAPCSDADACTVNDACVAGTCVGQAALCGDGNPCTDDSCDPAQGCLYANNQLACDDGNLCTTVDQCQGGKCVGSAPPDCNDGNPCTIDSCNPAEGCLHGNSNEKCSDGNACTVNDTCVDGTCVPGPAANCSDGNVCTIDSCNPAEGCAHSNSNEECDDGNACTDNDHCAGGKCVGDLAIDCDDANPCTTDSCDLKNGCVHTLNTAPCDDGDDCTVGDQCELGQCVSGTPVTCDDGNPCTADGCANGQCQHAPVDGACDDGNACTTVDQCQGGKCVGGTPPDCNDGNPCTIDSCNPAEGCAHTLSDEDCDDGDDCTVGDQCLQGQCVGGKPIDCDDNNECTTDGCVDGECLHAPVDGDCDDGNPCTLGDVCANGKCLWTSLNDCDDANVCTDDSCNPLSGCVYTPAPGPCDDGNACTTQDSCSGGQCTGGPAPDCDDGNVCTDDWCNPAEGCAHGNTEPKDCDDGSACTTQDTCTDGVCVGGPAPDCNDGNVCTTDSCDAQQGCLHTDNDGAACDDGDPDTSNDKCTGGVCQGIAGGICGPNLLLDPVQVKPGWTLCYLNGSAPPALKNAPCHQLFDSSGKTYGCWHGHSTYPHENNNGMVENACKAGVQNSTTYWSWSGDDHILTVCIQNQ